MRYNVNYENNKIIIENIRDFELKHVFECGQAFRWYPDDDESYTGIAKQRVINVKKVRDTLIISNTNIEDFKNIWYEYFDLGRDYGELKKELSEDKVLGDAIKFGEGIRILKQDEWEILISFIISANNRIPMIKRAIKVICEKWGNPLEYNGKKYYTFPTPKQLGAASVNDLEDCSVGFRAKYINKATQMILNGDVDLYNLKKSDYVNARCELMKLPGVGPKVSDCISLFSMQHYESFPVDIWVKRVMQYFYLTPDVSLTKIQKYAQDKYKNLAGFAQQYLFYYARDMKGKEIII